MTWISSDCNEVYTNGMVSYVDMVLEVEEASSARRSSTQRRVSTNIEKTLVKLFDGHRKESS